MKMSYVFFGSLIILIIIYAFLHKQPTKIEHLTTSTSVTSPTSVIFPTTTDNEEESSDTGQLCCDESSSNLSVLITNLNSKYDALASEYSSLQEQLTTNSERIQYIYDEYDSANDKLQAEMNS